MWIAVMYPSRANDLVLPVSFDDRRAGWKVSVVLPMVAQTVKYRGEGIYPRWAAQQPQQAEHIQPDIPRR